MNDFILNLLAISKDLENKKSPDAIMYISCKFNTSYTEAEEYYSEWRKVYKRLTAEQINKIVEDNASKVKKKPGRKSKTSGRKKGGA